MSQKSSLPQAARSVSQVLMSDSQYRYWNGEYCADARYERPYLGPKW
jgi:hypothetical protein